MAGFCIGEVMGREFLVCAALLAIFRYPIGIRSYKE